MKFKKKIRTQFNKFNAKFVSYSEINEENKKNNFFRQKQKTIKDE